MTTAAFAPATLLPPTEKRWLGPLLLALVAHALLVAALTWGVSWKRAPVVNVVAQAELWSRLPQTAAPKAVEVPPEAAEPPPPPVQPKPTPAPEPKPAPPPPAPDLTQQQADIALQKKKQEEKKQREDAERQLALKAEADKKAKEAKEQQARKEAEREKDLKAQKLAAEKQAADKLADAKKAAEKKAADKLASEKAAADKKLAEQKELKAQQAKDAQQKAQRDQAATKADADRMAKERAENMKRIAGMAGATGDAGSTGTAKVSSGPSKSYAGRIVGAVKPNIVFTDSVSGNPAADVEVRTLPDGTIASRKLVKSSGSAAWDDAVLKALDRTTKLPRDEDGRVPTLLVITFKPND